jgi:catechol 2,3-dioxygenase-like lactoylglutathione lyase family enzyme
MRLNHVTLPATDVERSAEFYVRFGLTQIVESYPNYTRFVDPEGGTTLPLQLTESPPREPGVTIHFEVEDVDGAVRSLVEKGFEFESEPVDQRYLWREATLVDPDGHRIFIYHAGRNRLDPPWRMPR